MSNVFNMLGGGKAGLNPQIVVTAPTGSTVTCDSVQGTEVSGTWTFNVAIGTHTIVATSSDQTKTATETVNVDEVGLYEVEIEYSTYLYNEGDECTSITGGWTAFSIANGGYGVGTSEKLTSSIHFASNGINQSQYACEATKIDTTGYSKLCAEISIVSQQSSSYCEMGVMLMSSWSTSSITHIARAVKQTVATHTLELDVTSYQGEYYVGVWGYYLGEGYTYKVWLE